MAYSTFSTILHYLINNNKQTSTVKDILKFFIIYYYFVDVCTPKIIELHIFILIYIHLDNELYADFGLFWVCRECLFSIKKLCRIQIRNLESVEKREKGIPLLHYFTEYNTLN